MNHEKVSLLVDELQSRGQYSFTREEILRKSGQSIRAVRRALERMQQKGRIALVSRGFYVIIPLEYREGRILPAEWFIHQMMGFLKLPYYVGLLSAAAIHGAAHQKPQEFQVLVNKQLRPVHVNGLRIHFVMKNNLKITSGIIQTKTETGYIQVSGPELTALDLMKYPRISGGLDNIATVLSELGEKIRPDELLLVAREEKSLVYVQRLGYLLDYLDFESRAESLASWLSAQKPNQVLLDPAHPRGKSTFNKKWRLFENLSIEVEHL